MAGAGESKNKYFLQSEYIERYGTGSQDPLMRCGLAKKWRPDQQNRGPRPAKRTPKAIEMRPCVVWKAFGARATPGLPTGSCATTFWTAFCSQMGTQWGSIFDPGLTSNASLANLSRIGKGVKKHRFPEPSKNAKVGADTPFIQ